MSKSIVIEETTFLFVENTWTLVVEAAELSPSFS
jgi:hypothetical protein